MAYLGCNVIEIKKEKYFWQITLDREEVHNAFHPEMIASITEFYREVNQSDGIHFVFMNAKGKSFCAGADLNWMKDMSNYTKEENFEDSLKLFDMFLAIYECRVPSICYAHGNVFGGGLGLLATQDMVFLEKDTKLCFSEVKWGLSPATISPFLMAKIGESASKKLMLSAEVFSADMAKDYQLAHFTGNHSEISEALEKLSSDLISHGREALIGTKKILNSMGMSPKDYREQTAKLIAERRVSKEGQEGLQFFLTKKQPSWKVKAKGVSL